MIEGEMGEMGKVGEIGEVVFEDSRVDTNVFLKK
jgi:hypothetical protein